MAAVEPLESSRALPPFGASEMVAVLCGWKERAIELAVRIRCSITRFVCVCAQHSVDEILMWCK